MEISSPPPQAGYLVSFSRDSVEFGFLGTVEISIAAEPEHDTENVRECDIFTANLKHKGNSLHEEDVLTAAQGVGYNGDVAPFIEKALC